MMSPIELATSPAAPSQTLPLFKLLVSTEQFTVSAENMPHFWTRINEQIECHASATDLKCFTEWALQQSYSPALTADQKLQLLDIAWKVQQLLWSGMGIG